MFPVTDYLLTSQKLRSKKEYQNSTSNIELYVKNIYIMIITGALTRCSDAAHLNGAGHMTSCSTLWVHEGPLLSSNQVTWYTLKHTESAINVSIKLIPLENIHNVTFLHTQTH